MVKFKPNQNAVIDLENGTIETTMTKLFIYDLKGNLKGKAGVKYSKDFDFDILLNIAKKDSASFDVNIM